MKAFALILVLSWTAGVRFVSARDLFVLDGRVFRDFIVTSTHSDSLRFTHKAGVTAISTESLVRADYYELGIHKATPSPPPIVHVPSPRANLVAEKSALQSRSYGDRSYAARSYVPENLEDEAASSKTDYSASESSGRVFVKGYFRKDGTYVRSHTRRR